MKFLLTVSFCSIMLKFDFSFLSSLSIFFFLSISMMSLNNSFGLLNIDIMSTLFLSLVFIVSVFSFLSVFLSMKQSDEKKVEQTFLMIMFILLNMCFVFDSMFIFYINFEIIFLFMFFFLFSLSSKMNREMASYYMFFITLATSIPLLVLMFSSLDEEQILSMMMILFNQNMWWMFILLVFLVKIPLFGLHMWLPKAHVEATLSGSIFLSGILLKIGIYGIFRVSLMKMSALTHFSSIFSCVGWVSSLIVAMICYRQVDCKSLVAYSSVVHMGMCTNGALSGSNTGFSSCMYMVLSHGVSSPLMFFLVYMFYDRQNSRSLIMMKGVNSLHPLLFLSGFLIMISSLGMPPLLSFFSEFMLGISALLINHILIPVSLFIFFLSGLYMIFYFIYFSQGNPSNFGYMNISKMDLSLIFSLIFYLF
uniref:NADH-ubiquinone oxidoreductase chain 4 n=1 Tax=Steganacarus magnus TaxID=52000 RepID=B6Z5V1_9ACAR|nr:NADH dehydrogenase subunit 4 [Steganacarus magnus]ACH41152.1 NADH dehydrogenase subunit 4 [Steganacarus magnus]